MTSIFQLPPEIIYKYVSFETGMKIITDNNLMFTKPEDFNDPYDCYPGLINFDKPTPDDIKRIISKNSKLSRSEKRSKVSKFIKDPSIFIEAHKKAQDERMSMIGVSCFSELYDQMLMWSHYGDKHKGLCIGFESELIRKDYILHEVRYRSSFDKVNFYDDKSKCIENWLLTKSNNWEYEKEVRAISYDSNGLIPFDQEFIKEVYFGSKFENKHIVFEELDSLGYNIDLFDLELLENEFKLKRKIAR